MNEAEMQRMPAAYKTDGQKEWVKDPASCGVGRRRGSDPAWLWLWHRPAPAALILPQVWEPPYAAGVAGKRKRRLKKSLFRLTDIEKRMVSGGDSLGVGGCTNWVKLKSTR